MSYVDGFLLPVPKKNIKTYTALARKAGKVWKEYGALDYKECAADDLEAMGLTPFTKSITVKKNETIIFAFIVFKSRSHRDSVNKKVMKDPRIQAMGDPGNMPFDMKRMCYGGFKTIVDL